MQRAKVVDNALPNGDFQDSSTQAALDGTILRAGFQNDNFNNLFELVENSGQTLVDDDHSQISKAVVKQSLAGYYKDVGVINAIQLDNSGIDEETLFDGMMMVFAPKYANTGAVTIKIKSLATKPLKYKGADLVSGFLKISAKYIAIYDATNGWFNIESISNNISSTNNAIARFDGSLGIVQDSPEVVVTDNNELGIGTSSPVAKLDVLGTKNDLIAAFRGDGIYQRINMKQTVEKGNGTIDIFPTTAPGSGTAVQYFRIKNNIATGISRHIFEVEDNANFESDVDILGVLTVQEIDSVQALHKTDALRLVGDTLSLYKGDGTSESVSIPDFDLSHSFLENGYQKLSNGLIIQWGVTASVDQNLTTTTTFPVTFPTMCLNITGISNTHVTSAASESAVVSKTNSNFVFQAGSGGGGQPRGINYIAIGY